MTNFVVNTKKKTTFPHYWEHSIGSCHAYTALREDYRKQLEKVHDELGFERVRFHGLFNDDMSVCTSPMSPNPEEAKKIIYNFANVDNIFDFLLSIGMKPFIEVGGMPSCLASSKSSCFSYEMNISPPADYEQWNTFIKAFIEHLANRYGVKEVQDWYFEIWNEPNNSMFWSGTKEQYFELYKNTVRAIKSVNEAFKVGGPATACNMWIPEFIEFCEGNNTPLDFITTHHYPADETLWRNGDFSFGAMMKLLMSGEKRSFSRDIMKQMAASTQEQAKKYPLYYTEWNISASSKDTLHDDSYAAAMVAKILADNDGLVDGYSYWTFSDIFEELNQHAGTYHGGFGILNYYGIPKPVYRTFELFHNTGTKRFEVISNNLDCTVEMIALDIPNGIRLITYNYSTSDRVANDEQISIKLPEEYHGFDIKIQRIDSGHANPKAKWKEMGSPEYLKTEQIDVLTKASEMVSEILSSLEVTVPAFGVCAIDIVNDNKFTKKERDEDL